jgi:hypothetical protein
MYKPLGVKLVLVILFKYKNVDLTICLSTKVYKYSLATWQNRPDFFIKKVDN